MEDTLFAILLFIAFNVFTAWLIGSPSEDLEPQKKVSETVTTTPNKTPVSTLTIEQQCKEVFTEILTPEKTSEKVHLSEKEIDELGIREARKVIAALNKGLKRNDSRRIRLKVNGKDHKLSWLKAQIKSKLQQEPEAESTISKVIAASRNVA